MYIDSGLCRYHIVNLPSEIERELFDLYGNAASVEPDTSQWYDYHLDVKHTSLLRRVLRPQVVIDVEGQLPFNPVSPDKLLPSLEWALNWCVAAYENQKLLIHSSVVTKSGKAILFPAVSGSGKSTLATYLGANGWQMYSDELSVISLDSAHVNPIYRPSSLKNASIDVIKSHCNNVSFSPVTRATHKGDIAHVKLYSYNQFKTFAPVPVKAVVFPKYQKNSETTIMRLSKINGFGALHRQCFNYEILGHAGFQLLSRLSQQVSFYHVEYSDLAEMDELVCDILADKC